MSKNPCTGVKAAGRNKGLLIASAFLSLGPEGGRSPVEHRGNLYVRTSVRPSVRPYVRPPQPKASEAGLGLQGASSGLPGLIQASEGLN